MWRSVIVPVVMSVVCGGASAQSFDHSLLDGVLKKHVDKDGWVNYAALKKDSANLDRYIAQLRSAPISRLGIADKLALLINAYNACTLKLIVENYPIKSIMDIPKNRRWDHVRWNIGGNIWSLNQIEHQQIRARYNEPRIHFALVCAAVGCPPLRNEAYIGSKLQRQLDAQAKYVHGHPTWFRMAGGTVQLTKLYSWYGNDFKTGNRTVLSYAARYAPELQAALQQGNQPAISYLEYDWRLNSTGNKSSR